MAIYKVKQGDCINSIADEHGLFWEQIWNHGENAKLKNERKDPNTLCPGDELFVPEKEPGEVNCACDQKHTFRLKGVPAKMKVQMLVNEEPRKNEEYTLFIDDRRVQEGKTDANGFIEASIPPNAKKGEIVFVDEDGNKEFHPFDLGTVDPIDTEEGVAGRLQNLGYYEGDLEEALKEFQSRYELEVTGTINDETKRKLKEIFGQ
ncbi:MAG: peptidoglycan-binding protein [Planctomycetes bacterium]|nr:peptidoglycan-binding protein [Planctomycetota bacterium]